MMEKYTNEIQAIHTKSGFFPNRSMRKRFTGPKLFEAGMSFLERIHEECKGSIGATQQELEEEQEELRRLNTAETTEKPELTFEYLKSIGKEEWMFW
jgi:hypothetical protein